MDKFNYQAIGTIHSPVKRLEGTPIQLIGAIGVMAEVEIFPEFVEGLQGLSEISPHKHHRITKRISRVSPLLLQR